MFRYYLNEFICFKGLRENSPGLLNELSRSYHESCKDATYSLVFNDTKYFESFVVLLGPQRILIQPVEIFISQRYESLLCLYTHNGTRHPVGSAQHAVPTQMGEISGPHVYRPNTNILGNVCSDLYHRARGVLQASKADHSLPLRPS
jgi:hypothetical protein